MARNDKYFRKKVWLNKKHTKYCWVKLFGNKKDMQQFYYDWDKKGGLLDGNHFEVKGVSLHYRRVVDGKSHPETGMVLLSFENCGAGVVTHEILHAVLWARKHHQNKKQYPIVIKSMKEEEEILRNHTYAVQQFYNWYWDIEERFKKSINNQ